MKEGLLGGSLRTVGAVTPDADGLRGLAARLAGHRQPLRAAIESMTGARFVHDRLELEGWEVGICPRVYQSGESNRRGSRDRQRARPP